LPGFEPAAPLLHHQRVLGRPSLLALSCVASLAGCHGRGFLCDGSSVSVGTFTHGVLRHGRPLPPYGPGYVVPPLWRLRNNLYGTDELVSAIQHAARRVGREYPGGVLGVGDLSPRGGGESKFHHSHENGRDADLIFFAVDERGKPAPPASSMPRYAADDLHAYAPTPTSSVAYGPFTPRRFDVVRNWALVRALLQDPSVEIQYLFCYEPLKQRLLAHARSIGEDPELVERATELLRQPGDSLPHDDHLHVRIFCSASDRPFGCVDRGPVRWWKKRYKYMPPARSFDLSDALARLVVSPFVSLPRAVP
jgi:penicillin-insensitive murein endopeptidase